MKTIANTMSAVPPITSAFFMEPPKSCVPEPHYSSYSNRQERTKAAAKNATASAKPVYLLHLGHGRLTELARGVPPVGGM
jgi:hypothetical protein